MNVQLLIGPVKLWPGGKHAGILQIAKRSFRFGLPTIGFDDLRRAPLGAIRYQNAKSEIACDQTLILLPAAPHADPHSPWLSIL